MAPSKHQLVTIRPLVIVVVFYWSPCELGHFKFSASHISRSLS